MSDLPRETGTGDASTPPRGSRLRGRIGPLPAARIALAAAVVAAAWSGWAWHSAAAQAAPPLAALRDRVLQAGEQAVINVSSLDYRHLSQGIALWEQSTTGSLRAGIVAGKSELEHAVIAAKSVTTARILDGAITSLTATSATFIVADQTTVTAASGGPTVNQYRMIGRMTRTASGWKLSSLTAAQADAASGTPAG
jgi:Mce-associated membrane protein